MFNSTSLGHHQTSESTLTATFENIVESLPLSAEERTNILTAKCDEEGFLIMIMHLVKAEINVENIKEILSHFDLRKKFETLSQCTQYGALALYWAGAYGQVELIKFLKENGADVTANFTQVPSCLVGAIRAGHIDALNALIEGLSLVEIQEVLQKTALGKTILHEIHDLNVLNWVLRYISISTSDSEKNTLDINQKDDLGYSPIHMAVIYENPLLVEAMINKGADHQSRNKFDRTAYQIVQTFLDGSSYKTFEFISKIMTQDAEAKGIPLPLTKASSAQIQTNPYSYHLDKSSSEFFDDNVTSPKAVEKGPPESAVYASERVKRIKSTTQSTSTAGKLSTAQTLAKFSSIITTPKSGITTPKSEHPQQTQRSNSAQEEIPPFKNKTSHTPKIRGG